MDNGEEIVGLNEDWSFLGAKLSEWVGGICMFLIVGEVFFKGRINYGMPIMLLSGVMTTIFLSRVRKQFPDEERGVMNTVLVALGFKPPKIPTPSEFQPSWSGLPIYQLDEESPFVKMGLHEKFFGERVPPEDLEA